MRLKGKLALVTGSSRGIGRAIALKLAQEGADIIVNFLRHRQGAEETARDTEKLGVNAQRFGQAVPLLEPVGGIQLDLELDRLDGRAFEALGQ